jgi:sugar O-acyltransferase (sialic acid O-acetyltransferase NeuD family)
MNIVIIGTGGMAKEIWGLCNALNNVLGFVTERAGYIDTFMGLPILGADAEFLMQERHHCVIANGSPDIRRKIAGSYLGSAHNFPNIIHPSAHILDARPDFGQQGITIMPGGVIQPDVKIGDFVHINMGVTIGHDVTIGKFSVINHNAGISGNVKIGEACLIGAGAIIIEGNTIGDGATVGAGAVITKDVPPGETWVGIPARPIKRERPTLAELYGVQ